MLNRIRRAHVIGATDAIRVKVIYPKYATKAGNIENSVQRLRRNFDDRTFAVCIAFNYAL